MMGEIETIIRQVEPRGLEILSPFKDLFPMDKTNVETIAESMRKEGFLKVYPIVCWHGIVVDGHTRVAAAKKAGVRWVECAYMSFPDEGSALEFAIRAQRNRRNLTEADIVRCIQALDQRKSRTEVAQMGGEAKNCLAPNGAKQAPVPKLKSAKKTAELLGISPRQVERVRTVLDHGSEETKAALASGQKTIGGAYKEVQEARKPVQQSEVQSDSGPALADFEVRLVKNFTAFDDGAALSQFIRWCRKASEKEIREATTCTPKKVEGAA